MGALYHLRRRRLPPHLAVGKQRPTFPVLLCIPCKSRNNVRPPGDVSRGGMGVGEDRWCLSPACDGGEPGEGTLVVVASSSYVPVRNPPWVVQGGTTPPITLMLTDACRPSAHPQRMSRSAASQRSIAPNEIGSRSLASYPDISVMPPAYGTPQVAIGRAVTST
jgi:hypothetical protein